MIVGCNPDQTPCFAADQGLHCLLLIQQLFDTLTGSEIELFKFYDKYGKEIRCPNAQRKYGMFSFQQIRGIL